MGKSRCLNNNLLNNFVDLENPATKLILTVGKNPKLKFKRFKIATLQFLAGITLHVATVTKVCRAEFKTI